MIVWMCPVANIIQRAHLQRVYSHRISLECKWPCHQLFWLVGSAINFSWNCLSRKKQLSKLQLLRHCKNCLHVLIESIVSISIKRFFIHMLASPLSEQWCHCFVDSLSPNTYVGRLTLSHVNPRAQRWIYNFNITDKMILIYWNDQNLHMWNVFH